MKKQTFILSLLMVVFLITGCSTTKIVQQYKNPETDIFEANKVLIVGISADSELRRVYEKRMVESLDKYDVVAVKSIDFFEKSFTDHKKSLEQLGDIENKLLDAGFDAILFTRVTGQESRVTLVDSYRNFARSYQTFEDYYYGNQHIYFKEQEERYQVYTTETSLFCICPGKERELLWSGEIEVVDANKMKKNINSYVSVLFDSLKENKLLIWQE